MKSHIALFIAVSLIVSACGRNETRSDAPQPTVAERQDVVTPSSPIPDRPAPDVPKGPVPEYPKPGQVNNHSSPEFKGGGEATK